MAKKKDDVCIPHNRWAFITEHKTGGKYLYVSKKKLTAEEVTKWQNDDTLLSVKRPDVTMVIIID